MPNRIVIRDNKNCQLSLDDNPDILNKIRSLLSYKIEGVEYTQAFKNGWDGITYLMGKNGSFPLGLLLQVTTFLDKRKISYEIEDKRILPVLNTPLQIHERLRALGREPRDYQLAMEKIACLHRKGIIRASTGSGKTVGATLITAQLNRPTIIYVTGLDLLQQFHQTLTEVFQQPIGFIGNGVCDIQQINVASVWSVGKALDLKFKLTEDDDGEEQDISITNKLDIQKLLKSTQVHIFDECHSVTCDTIREIYKNIDPLFIYGMSATPSRGDGQDLLIQSILGPQVINVPASLLIKRGILAAPVIKFVDVPALQIQSRTYAAVYSEYIVDNKLRNALVVKETKNLIAKGYQTLVLFKQIRHGKILKQLLEAAEIECEILDGRNSLEERNNIKERLVTNQLQVILASTIYDIGVDIPSLSGLILAGGGNSRIRAMQRIGRVIRSSKNKTHAAIVDFYDQVRFLKKHSMDRYRTYAQEEGFKILPSTMMKRLVT